MSDKVIIQRKIYGKNTFKNVIDTSFKEFISNDMVKEANVVSIDSFFNQYDNLFYSIPYSGSNSHLELVNRSSDYLGIGFQDLQEEIRTLREENISLKNQLITIARNTQ